MSTTAQKLLDRFPAIYRIRDAELARAAGTDRGPLEELLTLFAEQISVVEENMEELYDDLFIETCNEWVVPYIGDLIGYRGLHGTVPSVASPRAEVAHTIALRRRKGTATVLEQLARDVTGWDARAVEFFQHLATTQYMNHVRPHNRVWADIRDGGSMDWIGSAFDSLARTADVRRIESGRGRFNIPDVGIFLWRIQPHSRTGVPAHRVGPGQYRASPLNHDLPLYGVPRVEEEITHLAEPLNVPLPLSRRWLETHLDLYYGDQADGTRPSILLQVDGSDIEAHALDICDLSGDDAGWAHTPRPAGRYAIDPHLGRIALPPEIADTADVRVTWHEGFSANLGGGEYERGEGMADVRVPDDQATLGDALASLSGEGIVLITDNGVYAEDPHIDVNGGSTVEIRAANGRRPTLMRSTPLEITGEAGARVELNGLLLAGAGIVVPADGDNALASLTLSHCTLVPGLRLTPDGEPVDPSQPSLQVAGAGVEVTVTRSILGPTRLHERSELRAFDSILDATTALGVAVAHPDGTSAGGRLHLEGCTVLGKIHVREVDTVSNSILLARIEEGDPDWPVAVRTERRQVGCIRFSYLPFDSVVPRRYHCQPDSLEASRRTGPRFRSLRYGTPAYCQLTASTPDSIRRGAEDESEMGVFHHLYGPQRETNLRVRLREYLRAGLQAGIFYES